jgi:hypothetical protein
MIIGNEVEEGEEASVKEPNMEIKSENLDKGDNATISLHALNRTRTPQIIKFLGYIKKRKAIVLIDAGSTYNFIGRRLSHELNYFVYPISTF